jgi:flagellar basal-body rod protein FlgB
MAKHATAAQEVSAGNIANANQPGYKAKQVESFEVYMTRLRQSGGDNGTYSIRPSVFETTGGAKPNGNSVTLEQEILKSAEALGQHNLALSVYSKSLEMMRTALGRR